MISLAESASGIATETASDVLWFIVLGALVVSLLIWGLWRHDTARQEDLFKQHRGHKHGVVARKPEKKTRGKKKND